MTFLNFKFIGHKLCKYLTLGNLTLNIEAAVSSCYTGSSVNGVGTVAATSCGAGYSYCYVKKNLNHFNFWTWSIFF